MDDLAFPFPRIPLRAKIFSSDLERMDTASRETDNMSLSWLAHFHPGRRVEDGGWRTEDKGLWTIDADERWGERENVK